VPDGAGRVQQLYWQSAGTRLYADGFQDSELGSSCGPLQLGPMTLCDTHVGGAGTAFADPGCSEVLLSVAVTDEACDGAPRFINWQGDPFTCGPGSVRPVLGRHSGDAYFIYFDGQCRQLPNPDFLYYDLGAPVPAEQVLAHLSPVEY
jgi:hypothetical protein